MNVADLGSRDTVALACGFFREFHQPGIGGKVLDCGEALDVMDLVEDNPGEDLADARRGTKQK